MLQHPEVPGGRSSSDLYVLLWIKTGLMRADDDCHWLCTIGLLPID